MVEEFEGNFSDLNRRKLMQETAASAPDGFKGPAEETYEEIGATPYLHWCCAFK
jgi:hypothetical protein